MELDDETNKTPKSPAITIETWAYNAEKYIEECAESVLNQSFKDFEWIIFNNGCTDKTTDILDKYAKKDNRIKIFKNKKNTFLYNEPVNPEFIFYTENLLSEYWCMLDSDDYLHPEFLKELYTAGRKYDADIVVAGSEMFEEENLKVHGMRCPPNFYINEITSLGDIFPQIYGCFRPLWGKLFKFSLIKKQLECRKENLKFTMKNGTDTMLCLDLLRFSKSVVGVDTPLHYYRIRKRSLYNSQIDKNRYLNYIDIYNDAKVLLRDWGKLNGINLKFIGNVLYFSLIDCMNISVNAINAPIDDRVETITNILLSPTIKKIINDSGLLFNLFDQATNSIDAIVKSYRKVHGN